ncbi:MAG: aspartate aminotransferase family protein, partial [Herbaspirillum sp.]
LRIIQETGFYTHLSIQTRKLTDGLCEAARAAQLPFSADALGGMFGLYFSPAAPTGYAEVMQGDQNRFKVFFHAMLDAGVYLAPSAFEAGFVSAQHDDAIIAATVDAARDAFAAAAR